MFYNICPELFCFELHITIKCCTVSDYQTSNSGCFVVTHTVRVEDGHLETDMRSTRNTVNHVDCYFEDLRVGFSQFPCDIACAAPQLSFNSCSYGTFVWWHPCSLWVICFHKCCSRISLVTWLVHLQEKVIIIDRGWS